MTVMEQADRIHLRDHVVAADIGAFQSERGRNQRLRFNLTVDLRDIGASRDDQVDSVLSYDVLIYAISAALADQRYNLVETLAEKIAAEVLDHPRAAAITVSVEKLDRGPGALGITIHRRAGRVSPDRTALPVDVILWSPGMAPPTGAAILCPPAPDLPVPQGGDQRRIALLALDQAAWALSGQLGLEIAESQTELDAAIRAGQPVIWAPTKLAADAAIPALPLHLASWLADRLGSDHVTIAATVPLPDPVLPQIALRPLPGAGA